MPFEKGNEFGFKKGYIPWNKGKTKLDDPLLEQHSIRMRTLHETTDIYTNHGEVMSKIMKAKFEGGELHFWQTGATKETDERLKQHGLKMQKLWSSPDFRKKMEIALAPYHEREKGHPCYCTKKESIEKMRQAQKRNWADPNSVYNTPAFREKWNKGKELARESPITLTKLSQAYHRRPTNLEKEFMEVFPELDYVGGFSLWVGRKNPDFHLKNTNICIDLFSDYWHDLEEVEPRIRYFAERGYRLLIIWEHDWNEKREEIVAQVRALLIEKPTTALALTFEIIQHGGSY